MHHSDLSYLAQVFSMPVCDEVPELGSSSCHEPLGFALLVTGAAMPVCDEVYKLGISLCHAPLSDLSYLSQMLPCLCVMKCPS